MLPGVLFFRCRLCGHMEKSTHTPDLLITLILLGTGNAEEVNRRFAGVPVSSESIHHCADGSLGIADIVGGREDDPR